ncbi:MAG: RNA polymerase sigma-70 factor [Odoribacter sp.]
MEENLLSDFSSKDDKKAFRYLYDKYAAMLRYFASKYLDDRSTIDDVVQDAFLDLWEKRKQFKEENAMKAYLYKIVRSFSIDMIRHRQVENKYTEHIAHEGEEQNFFFENIIETEVFQLVKSVFNELSPACREVYELSLHGKSHEEISTLLDISVNTVKKHKNNANHYMRERLKNALSILLWI